METFIREHAEIIILVISAMFMITSFFLREDRKAIKMKTERNAKRIEEIEKNYNAKFEKVYEKQDLIKKEMNVNHRELMTEISKLAVDIAKIKR